MYGFDHLPLAQRVIQVDEFVGAITQSVTTDNFQRYVIPTGATFLYIVLVSAGGFGAVPIVGAATSGGGGGGSGAIVKALCPVFLLPKVLYVYLPTSPSVGVTQISVRPSTAVVDRLLYVGFGGDGVDTGAGGVAGAAMTSAQSRWSGTLALWVSQAGAAGGAGSTTNGTAVTALATLPLTGGGGGGGSSAGTGGNITGAGPFPTITGGASGANPGRGGMMLRQPFGGVGGSGGGGVNAAGTGLNFGGAGAIGCGGGGGGNAASGTPGAGGKGGPGYCLIVAF